MSDSDEKNNDALEVLYVITEVKKKGKRQIAVLEGGKETIAAVTGDQETAEALVKRFAAGAEGTDRQYILARYAKVEDMLNVKLAKKDIHK